MWIQIDDEVWDTYKESQAFLGVKTYGGLIRTIENYMNESSIDVFDDAKRSLVRDEPKALMLREKGMIEERYLRARKGSPKLVLETIIEGDHAFYNRRHNLIVVDPRALSELVVENAVGKLIDSKLGLDKNFNVKNANKIVAKAPIRDFWVDLQDTWIAKFTSLVAHEMIHKVLDDLEGNETSKKFDDLHFHVFMEKIPWNSCDMICWSDALETCSIGDTWF